MNNKFKLIGKFGSELAVLDLDVMQDLERLDETKDESDSLPCLTESLFL